MNKPSVFIFSNGNIAVTDKNGEQVPELQKSVVQMMCERLLNAGYDPTEFEFNLQRSGTATVFRTKDGWNWKF